MSPRRIAVGRAAAIRVVLALVVGSACLGAVAYAATGTGGGEIGIAGRHVAIGAPPPAGSPAGRGQQERAPRVRLIETPAASSTAADPQFRFHVPPRRKESEQPVPAPTGASTPAPRRRFQCRLDGGSWTACDSPYRLAGLAPGQHDFAVRALARDGREGPDVAYGWWQVEPAVAVSEAVAEGRPFSIEQTAALASLYPGDPAQPIPLAISNPNSVPIEVTSLTAAVVDLPGCTAENFALTGSGASPGTPLVVPAEGSVELPSESISAPSIALVDLPVNQDACQGAELEIALGGEARG
ncbi:MAG TPA: hypothetical protein VNR67_08225 [Solirubrobacterales bacterium]|nr:hypothetical protein [Solirubrobacterales bacterium]